MVLLLYYTSVKPREQKKRKQKSISFWRKCHLYFSLIYYILCQAALSARKNHNIFSKNSKKQLTIIGLYCII